MLIRREDFGDILELSNGSHKNIWFTCENCGIGVLQSYRNYINQSNGKFCRKCRNKHTANRKDVKIKQSEHSKKMWKNKEYREHMIAVLPKVCKDAWDRDDGSRRSLIWNKTSYNDVKRIIESEDYKLITSKDDYIRSGNILNVECPKGHIFKTHMGRWNQGHRCSSCNGNKKYTSDDIVKIIEKDGYKLLSDYINCMSLVELQCPKGHKFSMRWNNFQQGQRCPLCSHIVSNQEMEVQNFLSQYVDIEANNRSLIYPLELDIIIPSHKIAVEYCSLYFHGEDAYNKDKNYHLNKMEMCESIGYRLITIFSDEWLNKKNIVKKSLMHILGLTNKRVYARKCSISEISNDRANRFINEYHIQGSSISSIRLGAFHEKDLVGVMTFSKPSISKGSHNKDGLWEINRFCTSCSVIGLAGKLLKYFQRNYKWSIIYSYADRRWSIGTMYNTIGMNLISYTKPNYWYFRGNKRYHRYNFRKDILSEKVDFFDPNISEWENMKANKWDRIWDCGNLKFAVHKNPS